ncbi:hypothetical protein FBU59_002637 [Linderina macrospora]|uniref:Uncharacterized protein n=1 Tax=Linderina macrospora TaxID=4868 RepID=A0ACC1JAW5_9FUNG|nr:hypothetical protein FBU59_002637 [Linderina macrospora]
MSGTENIRESLRPRRFDLGAEDDDLEAMQRDFLSTNNKPAAKVIRRVQPPAVGATATTDSKKSTPPVPTMPAKAVPEPRKEDLGEPDASQVMDFVQRMSAAMKDYEKTESSSPTVQQPAPSKQQTPKKKLSLFAQRRLAMQQKALGSTAADEDVSETRGEATFLPKLMAPVPEHQVTEPVLPPESKPRVNGFPEIPVDFKLSSLREKDNKLAAEREAPGDEQLRSGEFWAQVRGQASKENDERIGAMSAEEIAEAQGEIQSLLSPEFIARLRARKDNSAEVEGLKQGNATKGPIHDTVVEDPVPEHGVAKKQVRFAAVEDISDADDLVPPPPPPAEWVNESTGVTTGGKQSGGIDVDNNETGVDSAFYGQLKRKYFPAEVVEEAKLAWILGHNQAKSPMERALHTSRKEEEQAANAVLNKSDDGATEEDLMAKAVSHVRFAFDGQIMAEEIADDVPTHLGLHHHGDDPDRPGYTIPELLHLSRSTVPAQRTVAMSTLGAILHRVNFGAWDLAQTIEVYAGLLDWEAEQYFAQGIADANKTSRCEAVVALWTWIVEMAKYKTLVRLSLPSNPDEVDALVGLPGADINLIPESKVAQGPLVSRTFTALDRIVTPAFLANVYEIVHLSLIPDQQLLMLAECIRHLSQMSDDFKQRIDQDAKLATLLQNRYPYLMSK